MMAGGVPDVIRLKEYAEGTSRAKKQTEAERPPSKKAIFLVKTQFLDRSSWQTTQYRAQGIALRRAGEISSPQPSQMP